MILVVSETLLRSVMTGITQASHGMLRHDTNTPQPAATIDPQALRTAALVALTIATGHTVTTAGP